MQQKKWDSPYKDWFHLDFNSDTQYHDGFRYEGWEGHNELVKLNLQNPAVVEHLLEAVRRWTQEFGVDGLRLDVAYSLPPEFWPGCAVLPGWLKPEFALLGETLHGDYNRWMNDDACHSVTNYGCYKGLWSSFNSGNMFEIGHSLARQFGPALDALQGQASAELFLDNHDVERIASMLTNPAHLRPAYGLLFSMPGVPAVYYGSEWGIPGQKSEGDAALRPALEMPQK